jgi:hypothetical protein
MDDDINKSETKKGDPAGSIHDPVTILSGLDERERQVVLALYYRKPGQSYDSLAKPLVMDRRTLFEYRMRDKVRRAFVLLSNQSMELEVIDVRNAVSRQAKKGNSYAAKVFLAHADRTMRMEEKYKAKIDRAVSLIMEALEKESQDIQKRIGDELKRIVDSLKDF